MDETGAQTEKKRRAFARRRKGEPRSLKPLRMVFEELRKYPGHVGLALLALVITAGATLAIPAGLRFVVDQGMGGERHPDFDMWVTADEDSVLVYGSIDGYMMNRYELVELTR